MGAVFDHKAWRHAGPVYGDLAVGDITQLNVNGVAKNFIVVHQGNPGSSLYDSSCDGTWLLMEDIYESRAWNSSTTADYENSTIHAYLNGTFLALLDSAVQGSIAQVKIPYSPGSSASSVNSGANGLSSKVFLPSACELGLSGTVADGAALGYFDGANNLRRIAKLNGTAYIYWTRTPNRSTNVVNVFITGGSAVNTPTRAIGVRPCFIMPSNQKIFS